MVECISKLGYGRALVGGLEIPGAFVENYRPVCLWWGTRLISVRGTLRAAAQASRASLGRIEAHVGMARVWSQGSPGLVVPSQASRLRRGSDTADSDPPVRTPLIRSHSVRPSSQAENPGASSVSGV